MNRVNDQRHTGTSCRQTPEQAGFATMGMDKVGAIGTKESREVFQSQAVFPRMDWANQFRNNCQQLGCAGDQCFERAFLTGGRS